MGAPPVNGPGPGGKKLKLMRVPKGQKVLGNQLSIANGLRIMQQSNLSVGSIDSAG